MGIPRDALAPYGLAASGLQETEIRAAPWALRLGKGLYYTHCLEVT